MARTRELVVSLKAESAELKKGLEEANKRLDKFAAAANKAAGVVGAAFALDMVADAGRALGGFIKQGADAADNMGKLAASVGVPVEQLSRLAYAADFSGSSTEELGAALGRLSKQMGEAHQGDKAQAALFQSLGVSITDASGQLRGAGDVFTDVAERFAGLEDGAAKTALAQEVFGKSGAALIPLLNEGAAGLKRMGEESDRFGNTVTASGAAGAAAFNDALDRLGKVGLGLATRVAQDLSPSMAALVDDLLAGEAGASAFDGAAATLANSLRTLVSAGILVGAAFNTAGVAIAALGSNLVNLAHRDFAAIGDVEKAARAQVADTWGAAFKQIESTWTKSGPGAQMEKDAEKTRPAADAIVANLGRVQKAAERAAAAQKELGRQLAGMLSLERERQGNAQEVEAHRARARGDSATAGFDSFEGALKTLAESLEAESTARYNAHELEGKGKLFEAHQALLAADAHKALAERASKAADAFAELTRSTEEASRAAAESAAELGGGFAGASALAEAQRAQDAQDARAAVPGQLGSMLTAGTGPATNAAVQGAQAGMAAGPWGAAAGAAVGLLSQSEQFGQALDGLEGVFQALSNSVGALVEPLLPLLDVVGALGMGLGALLEALSPIVEFVARPLYEVLKGFATVVLGLVRFIGTIVNAIASVFGGKGFDLKGVDEALTKLGRSSYDSARAQDKVAESSRDVAEGITNAARGFKVSLARFNAVNAEDRPAANADGTTGVPAVYVSATLDGQEIVRAVNVERRQGNVRRGGTTVERGGSWGP